MSELKANILKFYCFNWLNRPYLKELWWCGLSAYFRSAFVFSFVIAAASSELQCSSDVQWPAVCFCSRKHQNCRFSFSFVSLQIKFVCFRLLAGKEENLKTSSCHKANKVRPNFHISHWNYCEKSVLTAAAECLLVDYRVSLYFLKKWHYGDMVQHFSHYVSFRLK